MNTTYTTTRQKSPPLLRPLHARRKSMQRRLVSLEKRATQYQAKLDALVVLPEKRGFNKAVRVELATSRLLEVQGFIAMFNKLLRDLR